jgi:hypothetical protein
LFSFLWVGGDPDGGGAAEPTLLSMTEAEIGSVGGPSGIKTS